MDEPATPSDSAPTNPQDDLPGAPEAEAPTLVELPPSQDEAPQPGISSPLPGARWHWPGHLTRRQVVAGLGLTAGVVSLGVGLTLLVHSPTESSLPVESRDPGTAPSPRTTPYPTISPTSLVRTLQDWRSNHLTLQPSQRFQPQTGNGVVPLGVVEPTYPNPYNPYTVHLHAYLLGGEVIGNLQLFWYLGLESRDGTQFVAKLRVGPE